MSEYFWAVRYHQVQVSPYRAEREAAGEVVDETGTVIIEAVEASEGTEAGYERQVLDMFVIEDASKVAMFLIEDQVDIEFFKVSLDSEGVPVMSRVTIKEGVRETKTREVVEIEADGEVVASREIEA